MTVTGTARSRDHGNALDSRPRKSSAGITVANHPVLKIQRRERDEVVLAIGWTGYMPLTSLLEIGEVHALATEPLPATEASDRVVPGERLELGISPASAASGRRGPPRNHLAVLVRRATVPGIPDL